MAPTPGLALAAILFSLAYFGIAVLGFGGLGAFFSHPALVALVILGLAQLAIGLFGGANLSSGEQEDRGNRWVLVAFAMIGLLSAWLPAYTDRIGFWTLDGEAVRWLGVVLFGAGGVLRIWPVYVLGPRFSGLVAIQRGHTLVTTGIYRRVRNPSYAGMLIQLLGWGLAFRSGVGVLLAALAIPPVLARIRSEEQLLRARFGAAYEAYRARTWRLIPWLY